jgi:hypothetical protein
MHPNTPCYAQRPCPICTFQPCILQFLRYHLSSIHSSPVVPCCAIIKAVNSVIFRLNSATFASRLVLSTTTISALPLYFLLPTDWLCGPGLSGVYNSVNCPECVFEFARSDRKGRCLLADGKMEPVNFPVPGPIDGKGLAVPWKWSFAASNNQIAPTTGLWVTLRSMMRVLRSCSEENNILRGRMKIKGIKF